MKLQMGESSKHSNNKAE